ncbi:MAG: transposase [Tepidisphaeraceae bacterium]
MNLVPKKTLRRQAITGTARFLTFSCYRRLRLFDNPLIKDHFVKTIASALLAHDMALLAWVVMPEHVHLIVVPENAARVPAFLRTLKRPFARAVLDRWRMLNAAVLPRLRDRAGGTHFWQAGGGYDRAVIGEELIEKIRYVHANPVMRGLAVDSVSWKWSSAAAYAGRDNAVGPTIAFDLLPPLDRDVT